MSKCKITGKKLVIQLGRTDTQIIAMSGNEILYGKTYTTPVSAVEDGMIRNQDTIRELLKGAMMEPEFKGIRQVVFALCTSQVITETVTTPDLPAARLEKLLMTNVDMYFPVDMHEYQLVWQVIGPKRNDSGTKEVNVQLWAIPVNMVTRYYQVANACGLSVAAIDFIGHSIAGAIGASFAESDKGGKSKKKAEHPSAVEEAEPQANPATQLHLLLDKDILGMTFVQDGQVMVQRFVRCGSDPAYQFSELAMMLEYFRTMDIGRGSAIKGIVSGALAEDRDVVQELEDIMGIPLTKFSTSYDLSWFLCVGAACTTLDFGIPSLNKPGTARREFQSHLWQYGLLLAGALAVLFVVLTLMTSRLTWSSEISSLANTQQMLTIQNSKVAGYADNYYDYESKYDAYSNDWEAIFKTLRKNYHDNLVLIMEELEEIMPEKVNVVNMQIDANGLNVVFSCDTKEEAAYLIAALDDMKSADLVRPVSDLMGGGGGAAKSYGNGTAKEAAPREGSSVVVEGYAWNEQAFFEMALGMSAEELTDLENAYARTDLQAGSSMSDIQNNVSLPDRKAAMKEMATRNPFAVNRMVKLMKADMEKMMSGSGNAILFNLQIMMDLLDYEEVLTEGVPTDPEEAKEIIGGIIDVLTEDETRLQKTEALMATDDVLAVYYIIHVDGDDEPLYYLNTGMLYEDAKQGSFRTTNANVTAKLKDLLSDIPKEPDETLPDGHYEESTDALKKVLAFMGDEIGDSLLLGRIWEYISAGTIENSSEEAAALDAYIQNGNVDAELEEILKRYNSEQEMTTVISGMMMNYKANEGNAVLNARLKVIEDQMSSGETQPDETKPNETKPFDEQMMEIVVKEFQEYWDNGPETDDPFDNMFEEYMKTGKTDLAGTGLEDMIPEGFDKDADSYFGYAVSQALENYLSRGLEAGKYYSTLMNKYFTSGGNSGYPYFDDKIDALLEGGAVNTQLSYLISAYRKAGETGHDVMDSLFKKYEDKSINSTGILALDKALKAVYSQQVNASTQQAVQQAAQKASGGGVKDTRLYFSVILNYKEELANVERNLKGLDYEDKIAKLEVGVE